LLNFDSEEEKAKRLFLEFLGAKSEKEIEIPVKERLVHRPLLSELINGDIIDKTERNQLIYRACVDFGYSLSEISKTLGMHYASISRVFSNERKKMLKYKT